MLRNGGWPGLAERVKQLSQSYCRFTEHHHRHDHRHDADGDDSEQLPTSLVINGRGRSDLNSSSLVPWPVFTVNPAEEKCGPRFRFRLVSTANTFCPLQFSIEDHNLTLIATDGQYLEPEEV